MSFSQAVSEGLAPDGGLFVPESLPDISQRLASWEGLDYPSLSFEFLKLFADDIPERDLRKIVFDSYKRFDTPEVAPLRKLGGGLYMLTSVYDNNYPQLEGLSDSEKEVMGRKANPSTRE